MTPRERKYHKRNSYAHWWLMQPVVGYDAVQGYYKHNIKGWIFNSVCVVLHPVLYPNLRTSNFTAQNLTGIFKENDYRRYGILNALKRKEAA